MDGNDQRRASATSQTPGIALICMCAFDDSPTFFAKLKKHTDEAIKSGNKAYWLSFDSLTAAAPVPDGVIYLRLSEPAGRFSFVGAFARAYKLAPLLRFLRPETIVALTPRMRFILGLCLWRKDWFLLKSGARFPVLASLPALFLAGVIPFISPRRYFLIRRQWITAEKAAKEILRSDWYQESYGISGDRDFCIKHFRLVGQFAGYSPNPLFWPRWYAKKYLAAKTEMPSCHYFRKSVTGEFDPNPHFRSTWYRAQTRLAHGNAGHLLIHYLKHPNAVSLDPNPLFDATWYTRKYEDFVEGEQTPLEHFLRTGATRAPAPFFEQYPGIQMDATYSEISFGELFAREFNMRKPTSALMHVRPFEGRSGRRFAVCTVMVGKYDVPRKVGFADPQIDFYFVTDDATNTAPDGWTKVVVTVKEALSAVQMSRYIKMHLTEFVPNCEHYDAIGYVDGNIEIIGPLAGLFEAFADSDAVVGLVPHPARFCTYQEGAAVIYFEKDSLENVTKVLDFLKDEEFPEGIGLYEMNFFTIKPGPGAETFLARWWALFRTLGNRDQLLVPYLLWKYGVRAHLITSAGVSAKEISSFHVHRHLDAPL